MTLNDLIKDAPAGGEFRWVHHTKFSAINKKAPCYILDPADVSGEDSPGESFRVLKGKEIAEFGAYRTRRLVLEAWERMKNE